MRFAVEAWDPDYGVPADDGALVPADTQVDVNVELPASSWAPVSPSAGPIPGQIVFVDGVRRVDASIWITAEDRQRQGLCASYAAGAVCCTDRARLDAVSVERGLFTQAAGAAAIGTCHGDYPVRAVGGDAPADLVLGVQNRMRDLEVRLANDLGVADLVVVDGPLGARERTPKMIGYIKTHKVAYLPPVVAGVVGELRAGERTPLFVTSAPAWSRYSWYLRLPSTVDHAWSGVVRCEASADLDPREAAALADASARGLLRFASHEHKDPRAPQNLYPIGGLERELRRRLGDRELLYRALRRAAREP